MLFRLRTREGDKSPCGSALVAPSRAFRKPHTRWRQFASQTDMRVCVDEMYAKIPQQLSQGCAQHTNEDIDRFLFCTVVFRNLNWCTNLQMQQG